VATSASASSTGDGSSRDTGDAPHRAGAFDIRVFIGSLIGIYGVVLVVTGIVASDGRTINIWAGLGMVAASVFFVAWARLRPVVVPEDPTPTDDERPAGH